MVGHLLLVARVHPDRQGCVGSVDGLPVAAGQCQSRSYVQQGLGERGIPRHGQDRLVERDGPGDVSRQQQVVAVQCIELAATAGVGHRCRDLLRDPDRLLDLTERPGERGGPAHRQVGALPVGGGHGPGRAQHLLGLSAPAQVVERVPQHQGGVDRAPLAPGRPTASGGRCRCSQWRSPRARGYPSAANDYAVGASAGGRHGRPSCEPIPTGTDVPSMRIWQCAEAHRARLGQSRLR
jgi:hypothetical protein